jgi:hypothetical protein
VQTILHENERDAELYLRRLLKNDRLKTMGIVRSTLQSGVNTAITVDVKVYGAFNHCCNLAAGWGRLYR